VIGTARSEQHDFLRELGIDEQIDYETEAFEESISEVDVVIDLVGTEEYGLRSLQILREGGVLVEVPSGVNESVLAAAEEESKRATGFLVEPDHLGLESLAALAEEGRLRIVVDKTFPLERAAEAHEYLQSGKAHDHDSEAPLFGKGRSSSALLTTTAPPPHALLSGRWRHGRSTRPEFPLRRSRVAQRHLFGPIHVRGSA
jgi:hypothetical protein